MKCLFIYNPVSGKSKKILKNLNYIKETLAKKYEVLDVVRTEYPKHATKLASEACGVYDVIVFSGGDGTFNEVIQGVAEKESRPILSYLPAGTACDMAKNLAIPRNFKKALKIAVSGSCKKSDVCKINDGYYIYIAGIGAYTDTTYNTNQNLKRKIGWLAYFIDGFKKTFSIKKIPMKLTANGETYKEEVLLLLIANSKSVGGFKFNPKGNLNDGKVDIIVVKQNIFKLPFNVWKLFIFGVNKMKNKKSYRFIKTDKVEIDVADNITWNIDGEASVKGKVKIEVLKRHVTFLVDKRKARQLY